MVRFILPKRENWHRAPPSMVRNGEVNYSYRPVQTDPLIKAADGGIDLKKIAPKKRVY